ncbi:hypothetical protein OPKNFCMD_2635 [Methylobacterium crusticola]|uniref:Uncharacterized protein n=1 Tax=Methylobacterium crusticola TaxID=1697972 RepID=A0ABQ4QY87_9HYPH|nr:hypothetical protein [Methylobacterium crusticola]GJD49899.1 hypothetical protein OPKNFCMD_2635 [Methylobacterium crusticola]
MSATGSRATQEEASRTWQLLTITALLRDVVAAPRAGDEARIREALALLRAVGAPCSETEARLHAVMRDLLATVA